jgi:DNA-binding transcriptional LysR family regulator
LFVSQSSLSVAVKDVERECGITIFERNNRGITPTREGVELLGYAKQVVEQADLMEARYAPGNKQSDQTLAVSSQHYSFPVETFLEFVAAYEGKGYTFTLRETRTHEVIEDVRDFRSDVGVLYLSSFNRAVLTRAFEEAKLEFHALLTAHPHIFVSEKHPLANRKQVSLDELADYPRYSFEQGNTDSFFYAEEPFAELPHEKRVIVSDRGTLSNLLAHHTGYTVSTGILSSEMHTGIVAIPLKTRELMEVGYLVSQERQLSTLAEHYIELLQMFIEDYNQSFSQL